MWLASNAQSEGLQALHTALLNSSAMIDEPGRLQHPPRNDRAALSAALFDAVPAKQEDYSDLSPSPPEDPTARRGAQFRRLRNAAVEDDYSDLSPNPPEDPTAWRGARFRGSRNAATASDDNPAASDRAGHGRGAFE